MPLGSRRVQNTKCFVNTKYSQAEVCTLQGWSKQKIKHKFQMAIAPTKYRDHSSYAQVLSIKGDKHQVVAKPSTVQKPSTIIHPSAP